MDCRKIMIGEHAFRRMFEREIAVESVLETLKKGEVIKAYPEDKPYPSYLILNFINEKPLHVVVAADPENGFCFVVTVYEPDTKKWSGDFKTKLYE